MLGPVTVDNPSSKSLTVVGGGGCGGGGGGCGGGGGGYTTGGSSSNGRNVTPEEAAQQNVMTYITVMLVPAIIMLVVRSNTMKYAVRHEYCLDYEEGAKTGKNGIDQWAEDASCTVMTEGYLIPWWDSHDDEINEYYTVPFNVTVTRTNGAQYYTSAYRSPINFGPKDSKNVAYCGGMKCCVVQKLVRSSPNWTPFLNSIYC